MWKHSRNTVRIACLTLALVLALGSLPAALAESFVKASKFTLGRKTLTLYVTTVENDPLTTKHSYQFTPNISPAAAKERVLNEGLINYISSKPAVVSVNPQTGEIKAHKVGCATITCRLLDGSNKKDTVKVTVKALPPQSVSLDCGGALTMEKGSRVLIAASVFPDTVINKGVKYSSSNKSVVSVSSTGGLTARKKGTATITAKAKAGGKSAKVKVKVVTRGGGEGTTYRFYGIANNDYDRIRYSNGKTENIDLPACKNDLTYMNKAYTYASFDGRRVARTYKRNLTGGGIRSLLGTIANNTAIDEDDVTIFYYTGHGADDGSLCGTNINSKSSFVDVATVKSYLDRVPGTVIVMLDSCFSGQFIQSKGGTVLSLQQKSVQAKLGVLRFNNAWLSALQKGKPDTAGRTSGLSSKALPDGDTARGFYKILTACAPDQESFAPAYPNDPRSPTKCGFFTTGLVDGMTISGNRAKGDANGDGVVTLQEMYTHSVAVVNTVRQTFKELDPYHRDVPEQTVMVWPQNDQTPVFSVGG